MDNILTKIEQILIKRKNASADNSYAASLYKKGDEAILKKIIEEAAEVLMATKDNKEEEIIYEVADLYFHLLILLSHKNIKLSKITEELAKRFGISGIQEKQNRIKL